MSEFPLIILNSHYLHYQVTPNITPLLSHFNQHQYVKHAYQGAVILKNKK